MLSLLASTFATVFLAELGDKTQLAIVSISGTSNRPGAVFAAQCVLILGLRLILRSSQGDALAPSAVEADEVPPGS